LDGEVKVIGEAVAKEIHARKSAEVEMEDSIKERIWVFDEELKATNSALKTSLIELGEDIRNHLGTFDGKLKVASDALTLEVDARKGSEVELRQSVNDRINELHGGLKAINDALVNRMDSRQQADEKLQQFIEDRIGIVHNEVRAIKRDATPRDAIEVLDTPSRVLAAQVEKLQCLAAQTQSQGERPMIEAPELPGSLRLTQDALSTDLAQAHPVLTDRSAEGTKDGGGRLYPKVTLLPKHTIQRQPSAGESRGTSVAPGSQVATEAKVSVCNHQTATGPQSQLHDATQETLLQKVMAFQDKVDSLAPVATVTPSPKPQARVIAAPSNHAAMGQNYQHVSAGWSQTSRPSTQDAVNMLPQYNRPQQHQGFMMYKS
jgi:hypothetical protein